jgi:hypothetical protein
MPEARKQEVRFHEILHAADNESGNENLTENQTSRVARALWSVLRDNPGLLSECGLGGRP